MLIDQILSTGDPILDRRSTSQTQDGAWAELLQRDPHAASKAYVWCAIELRWRLFSSSECAGCQSSRGAMCSSHRR